MRDNLDSFFKRGNPANELSRKTVAEVPSVKVIVEGAGLQPVKAISEGVSSRAVEVAIAFNL